MPILRPPHAAGGGTKLGRREQQGLMPVSTLHAPRLFLLPWLRPNSHLKAFRASCCRRLASVSGRSLGCTLRLAACASLSRRSDALFLSFLGDSPLERQVSVLERRLFWKLVLVGDVLDPPERLMAGRGAVAIGMVGVGVDVPDDPDEDV